jgi:hypothetical protein
VSGCTWAVEEGMMSPLNGLERPMISWNEHMAKLLKERVQSHVRAANVPTGKETKEYHGRTYLEEWIYVGLYSVDLSW